MILLYNARTRLLQQPNLAICLAGQRQGQELTGGRPSLGLPPAAFLPTCPISLPPSTLCTVRLSRDRNLPISGKCRGRQPCAMRVVQLMRHASLDLNHAPDLHIGFVQQRSACYPGENYTQDTCWRCICICTVQLDTCPEKVFPTQAYLMEMFKPDNVYLGSRMCYYHLSLNHLVLQPWRSPAFLFITTFGLSWRLLAQLKISACKIDHKVVL